MSSVLSRVCKQEFLLNMNGREKKKKVLIYLTGKADAPFFYNEIVSLIQTFDIIYVITYGDEPHTVKYIENKYNITIIIVRIGVKSLFYVPAIIRALFEPNIKEELSYISTKYHGKAKFYCVGYALYYIIFAIGVKKQLYKVLEENISCEVYLYSFWMSRAAFSLAMFEYKNYPNVRIIATRAHGYDLYEERNRAGYLPFRKLIAERMDKIFFISENGKRYFERYLKKRNIPGNEMDVIHMGVEESSYTKKHREKKEMTIVSCSTINQIKRLDIIIKFLQIIQAKIKVRWLHIGDGSMMNTIKSMAARELPDMRIQFLGKVDNEKIMSIYREEDVDFFINMSDSEGIPVSIMEALSEGIPVIARNVGGISEIVNDSNGFLLESVDKEYLESIADKIVECFKNKEQYADLSRKAVKMQRNNFNRETNNLKLVNAIMGVSEKI